MTSPPLFDLHALAMRRRRANPSTLFLHQRAREEAEDRMGMVNRVFTAPAVVTPFPQIWANFHPQLTTAPDRPTLPLAPASHDLIIHAMCLHAANDPVGALIQCRRALRPDGLLLVIGLGGQTLAELRAALGQAEIEQSGGLSPRVAPMAEIRDLGALMQRAGLALPVADSMTITAIYRDLFHLMHDLRAMGETNVLSARLRHLTRRAVFARAGALYAQSFPAAAGGIRAGFELITLTGWAPADSQPRPLRPGSARTRLADALGAVETPIDD